MQGEAQADCFCTRVLYDYLHSRYRHLKVFGWSDPTLQKFIHRAFFVFCFCFLHPSPGFSRQHVVFSLPFPICFRCSPLTPFILLTRPPQSHLFLTEIGVVLSNFARSALDDCIAEHRDDHHEQEVAGVHEVQVNE